MSLAGQCRLIEPGYDTFDVATELASELKITAEWSALGAIEIVPRGDLAPRAAPQREPLACRLQVQSRRELHGWPGMIWW